MRTLLTEHLRENSAPVLDAMKRIAEGMCQLAWGYAEAGVDGIYYASLGGEARWFTDEEFDRWIAPFDKLILSEIARRGARPSSTSARTACAWSATAPMGSAATW